MTTTQAPAKHFPGYRDDVQTLVDEHQELDDNTLLLAIYYAPQREPENLFLFEVLARFGEGVNADAEFMEAGFGPNSGFPLEPGQRLVLVLTNPQELYAAVEQGWEQFIELRDAVRMGHAEVLYKQDGRGDDLLRLLQ